MPRFAANLGYLFTERQPLERFEAAAAAGFEAVELQFPYAIAPSAVKAELARHHLRQLGLNTPLGREGEFGLAARPGRERDWQTAFGQALDYAVAIGATAIHCMSGCVPPHERPAAETVFIKNLSRAASEAAKANLTLLIEPINPRDRPCYFLNRVEHAASIVRTVGAPNLRIQLDFYHAQIVGGDLTRRIQAHFPLIGHVQIAAVPTRHEPDEGEVSYAAILAELDKLGYAGFVGCEYRPRARTEEGLGWVRPYGVVPKRASIARPLCSEGKNLCA